MSISDDVIKNVLMKYIGVKAYVVVHVDLDCDKVKNSIIKVIGVLLDEKKANDLADDYNCSQKGEDDDDGRYFRTYVSEFEINAISKEIQKEIYNMKNSIDIKHDID